MRPADLNPRKSPTALPVGFIWPLSDGCGGIAVVGLAQALRVLIVVVKNTRGTAGCSGLAGGKGLGAPLKRA
jgi:hypothetical protein